MLRMFMLAGVALAALVVEGVAQNPQQAVQNPQQAVQNPQQAVQNPQPGARAPGQFAAPGQTGQTTGLNQAIAGCLLLGNNEEIALSEWAQSRTQNPRVKEFAQMMVQDHEQAVSKLTQIAPQLASQAASIRENQGAGNNQPGQPGQPGQQQQVDQNYAASPQGQPGGAGTERQLFALQQRVAQECLALTQKELGAKQGAEFDNCYIASQIGAHVGMLAKLRGSQQFATGQLKQVIQESEQTVQKHLDHAKKLAKELKDQSEGRPQTSQRPGAQPPAR